MVSSSFKLSIGDPVSSPAEVRWLVSPEPEVQSHDSNLFFSKQFSILWADYANRFIVLRMFIARENPMQRRGFFFGTSSGVLSIEAFNWRRFLNSIFSRMARIITRRDDHAGGFIVTIVKAFTGSSQKSLLVKGSKRPERMDRSLVSEFTGHGIPSSTTFQACPNILEKQEFSNSRCQLDIRRPGTNRLILTAR